MNTITINKAVSNFPKLFQDTIDNFEETVIVGDTEAVVLVAQSQWNSIMETIKLLKDKQSLTALIEGQNTRQNKKSEGKSINEAFYDL